MFVRASPTVLIERDRIAEVGGVRPRGVDEFDAAGARVIPGLHDHHVHLRAWAAASTSVHVGPPDVTTAEQLARALQAEDRRLAADEWIRAVDYHESVAGELDRDALDAIVSGRPVRVQHRSGILWVLNSAALAAVGLSGDGRLSRQDEWLRARVPPLTLDLVAVSRVAATWGVTGFTDATPQDSDTGLRQLTGSVVQRLHLMSAPGVEPVGLEGATLGPAKVLLDDDRLPSLDELTDIIRDSHSSGRAVAVHCVTRVQAVLAVTAFSDAGTASGDRIEHGSVLSPELLPRLRQLGLTVVTQPGLVWSRGDRYVADVEAEDRPNLWRLASLSDAGVKVAAGTDAPYGDPNPWLHVRAATDRATRDGQTLGPDERITRGEALALFQGFPDDPSRPRTIAPGQPADLCLLAGDEVVATIVAGRVVYEAG